MTEEERIEFLARTLGRGIVGGGLGIGDDAAVFAPRQGDRVVLSVDAQVEGVHFERQWMSWEDIGYRATMAALSDLAAMGATPRYVLSSLALPRAFADEEFSSLVLGQRDAVREIGITVVGGNLTRANEVSIHTTVIGVVAADELAVERRGARAGDSVWLAGSLGLSGLACRALARGQVPDGFDLALASFRRPRARIEAGLAARASGATAMIDVSDGLALDASRLARASQVALVLDAGALMDACPDTTRLARKASEDPLTSIAHGGEDFALLATSTLPIAGFVRVGVVDEGRGVWLEGESGRQQLPATGFDHFAPHT